MMMNQSSSEELLQSNIILDFCTLYPSRVAVHTGKIASNSLEF